MNRTYHLSETGNIAVELLEIAGKPSVLAFYGSLGAGKTTLIGAICRQLGIVYSSSPTFAIMNEYTSTSGEPVYHMDWYRLKEADEALDAELDNALYSGNWCFVEWPEKAPEILPPHTLHIRLSPADDEERRQMEVSRIPFLE